MKFTNLNLKNIKIQSGLNLTEFVGTEIVPFTVTLTVESVFYSTSTVLLSSTLAVESTFYSTSTALLSASLSG